MQFDPAKIMQLLRDVEHDVLDDFAEMVAARAKARAPVRKMRRGKGRSRSAAKTKLGSLYTKAFYEHLRRTDARDANGNLTGKKVISTQAEAQQLGRHIASGQYRVKTRARGQVKLLGRIEDRKAKLYRNVGGEGKKTVKMTGRGRGVVKTIAGQSRSIRMSPTQVFRPNKGVSGAPLYSRAKSEFTTRGKTVELSATTRGVTFQPSGNFDKSIDSSGRYEMKSGRAVFVNTLGQLQFGGHLKESIESEGVRGTEHGYHATVSATAPYAIYVEFPTSHNAAQPFLLPALHESKHDLKPMLEEGLRKAGLKR